MVRGLDSDNKDAVGAGFGGPTSMEVFPEFPDNSDDRGK